MSNIYRLVYTDSGGTDHVLGVLGTGITDVPSSADAEYSLNNATLTRKLRDPNTLKVRGEASLLDNVPLTKSEFQSSEPELFWQVWDESSSEWFNEFRGYSESRGSISEDGEFAVKFYSHMKYLSEKEIDVSISSGTSLPNVLQQGLPSNYTVVAPSDVSHPTVANYSIKDQGQVFFRELTRQYGYTLAFTGEMQNGNNVVRFQPKGYGAIIETITGKRDSVDGDLDAVFKEWEKADTKNVVNKVRVEAGDGNGNKIEEVVTDQASIDDYGERFESVSIDYDLGGASAAQTIGESVLNPEPGEGGKVRVPRIDGDLTNDTFEVIDSQRSIDDAFTCVTQKNFYPDNTTYLTFEFESPEEKQAKKFVDIRNERAALTTTGSGPVTGDTGSTSPDVNGDTGDTSPDVSGATGDTSPNVAGLSDPDGSTDVIEQTESSQSFQSYSFGSGWETLGGTFSADFDDTEAAVAVVNLIFQGQGDPTDQGDLLSYTVNVRAVNEDQFIEVPGGNGVEIDRFDYAPDSGFYPAGNEAITFYVPGNHSGDDLVVEFEVEKGVGEGTTIDVGGQVNWYTVAQHEHGSGTYDAENHPHSDGTLDADNHPHSDGTLDADNHPHDSGNLSAETSTEEKTNR